MKKIGVFCYQGDSSSHLNALKNLGFQPYKLLYNSDFSDLDGIILPGGESSVQYKHITESGLDIKIKQYANNKTKIIFGTCAGAILLSTHKSNKVSGLGLIDIDITRNFYGKQIESGYFSIDGRKEAFIRAPEIKTLSNKITILLSFQNHPVLVKQNNIFATSFHPELGTFDKNNVIYKAFHSLL